MVDLSRKFDVLVIGGGNAALCAAISARRAGASVLVLEGAPKFYRGGNTRHTRNMRCAHDAATDILTGPYTEQEFWEDLLLVTEGQTDEDQLTGENAGRVHAKRLADSCRYLGAGAAGSVRFVLLGEPFRCPPPFHRS